MKDYVIIYKDSSSKEVDGEYARTLIQFLKAGFDGIYEGEDTDRIQKIILNKGITDDWNHYQRRQAILRGLKNTNPGMYEKQKQRWGM